MPLALPAVRVIHCFRRHRDDFIDWYIYKRHTLVMLHNNVSKYKQILVGNLNSLMYIYDSPDHKWGCFTYTWHVYDIQSDVNVYWAERGLLLTWYDPPGYVYCTWCLGAYKNWLCSPNTENITSLGHISNEHCIESTYFYLSIMHPPKIYDETHYSI